MILKKVAQTRAHLHVQNGHLRLFALLRQVRIRKVDHSGKV